jgi:hypothetical protein
MKLKHGTKTFDAVSLGQNIVVLTAGFVYVGNVFEAEDYIFVTDASNIRRSGTTRGFGELRTGPTKQTVLDPCGMLVVPKSQVLHYIPCVGFVA